MLELERSEAGSVSWNLKRNIPKSMPNQFTKMLGLDQVNLSKSIANQPPKMLELERSEAGSL